MLPCCLPGQWWRYPPGPASAVTSTDAVSVTPATGPGGGCGQASSTTDSELTNVVLVSPELGRQTGTTTCTCQAHLALAAAAAGVPYMASDSRLVLHHNLETGNTSAMQPPHRSVKPACNTPGAHIPLVAQTPSSPRSMSTELADLLIFMDNTPVTTIAQVDTRSQKLHVSYCHKHSVCLQPQA